MKHTPLYRLLLFAVVTLCVASCTKMNDLTDKFLNQGEIIYAAKVDTVVALAGENRIQLDLLVKAQRIESIRIYWNNYEDSLDVAIEGKTGKFSVLLNNMPEGGYLFNLVSFDKFGNPSLKYEVTAASYGENYKRTLFNRSFIAEFTQFDVAGDSMVIYWGSKVDGAVGMTLEYLDLQNREVTIEVPVDAATTTLRGLKGNVSYSSMFLPEKNAIDTFATESKVIPVHYERWVDKTNWTVTAYSSQSPSPSWPASNAIDGDINTPWHTAHNPVAPFPHYFIVDMGSEVEISSFYVYRRMDDSKGAQPTHQIFYAQTLSDPTDSEDAGWKNYGTYPFDNVVNIPQYSRNAEVVKARYFMYYVDANSRSAYAYIGEIGVATPVEPK